MTKRQQRARRGYALKRGECPSRGYVRGGTRYVNRVSGPTETVKRR